MSCSNSLNQILIILNILQVLFPDGCQEVKYLFIGIFIFFNIFLSERLLVDIVNVGVSCISLKHLGDDFFVEPAAIRRVWWVAKYSIEIDLPHEIIIFEVCFGGSKFVLFDELQDGILFFGMRKVGQLTLNIEEITARRYSGKCSGVKQIFSKHFWRREGPWKIWHYQWQLIYKSTNSIKSISISINK